MAVLSVVLWLSGCGEKSGRVGYESQKILSQWVGNEACARCHQRYYESFMKTGMGRSFPPLDVRALDSIVTFGAPVHEPGSGFSYVAFIRDNRLVMREYRVEQGRVTYEQERLATHQIGSANHTISFLEQQGGYFFEMPLTWYSLKKMWDMSPGYLYNNQRFDRPINSTCMNCHNGPSLRERSTENFFTNIGRGIGCESCHGPGKRHVNAADHSPNDRGLVRSTIENPLRWERELQMDLCQRCHLEGLSVWNDGVEPHMVEPGKPLSLYKAVFVSNSSLEMEAGFNIAAQADRLRKSACYEKSGTMTCTTCHEPHTTSSTMQKRYFNKTCFSCHTGEEHTISCSMAHSDAARATDCVSCHMSVGETSDIPHVAFTDHYIRRMPESQKQPAGKRTEQMERLVSIVHAADFETQLSQRGLAYFEFYQTQEQKDEYLDSTLVLLTEARKRGSMRRDGEDDYVWGTALNLKGRMHDAETALRRALERNPEHARAIYMLGNTLHLQGKSAEARDWFRRGISVQPRLVENHLGLGRALLALRDYRAATEVLLRCLEIDSLSYPEAPLMLATAYLRAGDLSRAVDRFRHVLRLHPGQEDALLGLIEVSARLKHWSEVLMRCETLLKRNPMHVPALLHKSSAYWNTGRRREAEQTARGVLMIDPGNARARSYLPTD
jgi:tetratricopeptide (TPR) repeat protein/ribosomal protein L31